MTKALKRVFKMSYRDICFGLQTGVCFCRGRHSENVKLAVNKTRWQSGGQALSGINIMETLNKL